MAKKTTEDSLSRMNQDWMGRGDHEWEPTSDGLPFDGADVQQYIKDALKNVSCFEGNSIYYFENEKIMQDWRDSNETDKDIKYPTYVMPMQFSGKIYNIELDGELVLNNGEGQTGAAYCYLKVPRIYTTERGVMDQTGKEVSDDYIIYVEYELDNSGNWTRYSTQTTGNKNYYIPLYVNKRTRVRIIVNSQSEHGTKATFLCAGNVYRYSGSLSYDNNNRNNNVPLIKGQNCTIKGFNCNASSGFYLTVHVDSTQIYSGAATNSTSLSVTPNASITSGIHTLYIRLRSGSASGTTVTTLSWPILYLNSTSESGVLFTTSDSKTIGNNTTGSLWTYMVYNAGNSVANVELLVGGEVDSSFSVNTCEFKTIQYSPDLSISENTTYTVNLRVGGVTSAGRTLTVTASSMYTPVKPGANDLVIHPSKSRNGTSTTSIINVANNRIIPVNVSGFDFKTDWFGIDENENPCIYIPAACKLELADYMPLNLNNSSVTFDINFKTSNVSNLSDILIDISDQNSNGEWIGLRVYGDKITIHNDYLSSKDAAAERPYEYNFEPDEQINIIISYYYNYLSSASSKKNYVLLYINGSISREINFGNSLYVPSSVKFGADNSDLYLYGFRVYNQGFSASLGQANYIASLTGKKQENAYNEINGILNSAHTEVTYQGCLDMKKNILLITSANGIPRLKDEAERNGTMTLIYDGDTSNAITWNNVRIYGQGTSSMKYYRWNLRIEGAADNDKKVAKKWSPSDMNVARLCFKKNVASGTHGHKMGVTLMYNALYKKIVHKDPAVSGSPLATNNVAVKQYPFYGFLKTSANDTPVFIGLYTGGPDKGDKFWFGYNSGDYISLEGTDHDKVGVAYMYPYEEMEPNLDDEMMAITTKAGGILEQWEVTGKKSKLPLWKNAYKVVYGHNLNVTLSSVPTSFTANGTTIKNEILDNGKLYYGSYKEGKYVQSPNYTYLPAGSLSKKTDFQNARAKHFKSEYGNYWNTDAVMFEYMFKFINAVSDNLMKNYYPQSISDETKMSLRQDDLDTMGPINNNGLNAKGYDVEINSQETGSTVSAFNGFDSTFARLLNHDEFATERKNMAIKIFDVMCELSGESSTNVYDKLITFYDKYLWQAQAAFPASAYNADTKWTYEDGEIAHLNNSTAIAPPTDAIKQVTGDGRLLERNWFIKRMIYLTSKYGYGDFAKKIASNGTLSRDYNTIPVQSAKPFPIDIVYQINHIPAYTGDSGVEYFKKTQYEVTAEGGVHVFGQMAGSGNTRYYIALGEFIQELTMSDYKPQEMSFSIGSGQKRLSKLDLSGDISTCTITNAPCLREFYFDSGEANAANVTITGCRRLQIVDASYSAATVVKIEGSSRLITLKLPNTITELNYNSLLNLVDFTIGRGNESDYKNIALIKINNCPRLPSLAIWSNATNAKTICITGINEDYTANPEAAEKVITFLVNRSTSGITWINESGNVITTSNAAKTAVQGTLTVPSSKCTDSQKTTIESKFGLNIIRV